MIYLSRRIKPNTGGAGRHRGGSELRVAAHGLEHALLGAPEPRHDAALHLAGALRRLPGLGRLRPQHPRADLRRAGRGAARRTRSPTGSFDDPALMAIDGERDLQAGQLHDPRAVRRGRPLPLGDEGRRRARRPAGAPRRGGRARRRRGPPRCRASPSRLRRLRPRRGYRRAAPRARPARAGVVGRRARAGPCRRVDRAGEGRLRGVDEALRAVGGRVPRLLGPARGLQPSRSRRRRCPPTVAEKPGKITPEESAADVPGRLEGRRASSRRRPAAATLERETLEALLDEKLSRREVKDIQSGYKDPDRFDKWLAVLQERVAYDDPIVLPMGEGLNVVRQPGRRAGDPMRLPGTTSAASTRTGRCTRSSSFATRDELLGEIYPKHGATATPSGWSCASSTARRPAACSRSRR